MKSNKITNKEIKASLAEIYKTLQFFSDKTFQQESQFILYLRMNNEEEKFRKFVTEYIEKNEQSGLQDKKGT